MKATRVCFPYFDVVMANGTVVAHASGTNVLPLPVLHPQVRDEVTLSSTDVARLSSDPDSTGSRLHHRELCLRWFYDCDQPTDTERAFLDRLVELAVKSCG